MEQILLLNRSGINQCVLFARELQGMASEPTDKHIIEVKDFDALGGVTNKLVAPLCSGQFVKLVLSLNILGASHK